MIFESLIWLLVSHHMGGWIISTPTHEEEQKQSRDLPFSDQKHFFRLNYWSIHESFVWRGKCHRYRPVPISYRPLLTFWVTCNLTIKYMEKQCLKRDRFRLFNMKIHLNVYLLYLTVKMAVDEQKYDIK